MLLNAWQAGRQAGRQNIYFLFIFVYKTSFLGCSSYVTTSLLRSYHVTLKLCKLSHSNVGLCTHTHTHTHIHTYTHTHIHTQTGLSNTLLCGKYLIEVWQSVKEPTRNPTPKTLQSTRYLRLEPVTACLLGPKTTLPAPHPPSATWMAVKRQISH